jgi:hypothetical protein
MIDLLEKGTYLVAVIVTASWLYGIRTSAEAGRDENRAMCGIVVLFILSLAAVPLLKVSPFHLLWLFAAALLVGLAASKTAARAPLLLSLLWVPGRLVYKAACLGIDWKEAERRRRILHRANELRESRGLTPQEAVKKAVEEEEGRG